MMFFIKSVNHHIFPSCFVHKDINMHPTVHDEKYNHGICSTICAQECTECINSCLAVRSEGASTARRCDNLLSAWTEAADEASPVSNPDVALQEDGIRAPTTGDERSLFEIGQRTPTARRLSSYNPPLERQWERSVKQVWENRTGSDSCSLPDRRELDIMGQS